MNRIQKMLKDEQEWNKAHGVTPEHMKRVNDILSKPVIAFPIFYKVVCKDSTVKTKDVDASDDNGQ
ncbi:MAG: hypothetical protein Q8M08_16195 [Bacteroidales bacterium]|nr:hypothetical protein [Bacteroidales bacterium]